MLINFMKIVIKYKNISFEIISQPFHFYHVIKVDKRNYGNKYKYQKSPQYTRKNHFWKINIVRLINTLNIGF